MNEADEAARERARKLLFRESQPEIRKKKALAREKEVRETNLLLVDRLASCNEKLLIAAARGRQDKILKALEEGADVNHEGPSRNTALHRAADNGNEDIMKLLLEKGANINAQNEHGKTPLMKVCFYKHMTCVRMLIEAKADMSMKDTQEGWNPLHRACVHGHDLVCRILLEYGADRDMLSDKTSKHTERGLVDNDSRSTAMMLAVQFNNECCIDQLNDDDLHGKQLREWFG
jgi:ankyrin repeat protein